MTNETPEDTVDELERIIASYLNAIEKGESPIQAELKAKFPNLADELQAFFDEHDQIRRGLQETDALTDAADSPKGSIDFHPYILQKKLGQGGMGSVWLARQTSPVKRQVAVKLIKAGKYSKQALARFSAERQALALMDHPNIAKVFDAGVTPDGRPFFVMELVRGTPITEFCDRRKLTPRERLELFVPVCHAVQHAHQKGIIHRDIKPSNVLVAQYDDCAAAKVIDFGLAKATGGELTDQTIETQMDTIIGTPQYMSPEQATLNNVDIDTRSDVYSLGVLLYELLVGTPPVEKQEMLDKGVLDILRAVREDEPPRPSLKLSNHEALPTLSANRSTDAKKLTTLLRRELDWIVMKALEKDRSRRYDTANSLAMDVQRYLSDAPVLAHPPSRAYRFQKFLRNNRGPVIATSLVGLTLVAGMIGTTWGLFAAQDAAEAERLARIDANRQRAVADIQREFAEFEKETSLEVTDFLVRYLGQADMTAQADAILAMGDNETLKPNPTLRDLLGRAGKELAAGKIDENFPEKYKVQGLLLDTVGYAYIGLGEYELAIEFLHRSAAILEEHLGLMDASTLQSRHRLAGAYLSQGQHKLAVPIAEQVLDARSSVLGEAHPHTLESVNNLALAYKGTGRVSEAIPLFQRTLARQIELLGSGDQETLKTQNNLALAKVNAGELEDAVRLLEQAREASVRSLKANHPITITTLNNLAFAYQASQKLAEAITIWEQVSLHQIKFQGPDHPLTTKTQANLASGYYAVGRQEDALELFERVRGAQVKNTTADHPERIAVLVYLGKIYRAKDELDTAILRLQEAAEEMEKQNFEHIYASVVITETVSAFEASGKWENAEAWRRKWILIVKEKDGAESETYAAQLDGLGRNLLRQEQWTDAESALRECLALRIDSEADNWSTYDTMSGLGTALMKQKKNVEAEKMLVEGCNGLKARQDSIPPAEASRLTEAIDRLIEMYEALHKVEEAQKWRTEQAKSIDEENPTSSAEYDDVPSDNE